MTPERWRAAALIALWMLAGATLGLGAFTLWTAQPLTESGVLGALRLVLAALVLAWWTQVYARMTRGESVPDTDRALRALRLAFPWLTALRLALWSLSVLALLVGGAPETSPVALTALLTVEAGFIAAKNAMYGTLVRDAAHPYDLQGRVKLAQWLNAAAAFSLAIGVVNVVPLAGMGGTRDLTQTLVFGLHAALDVAATLLALRAWQVQPVPDPPRQPG